MPHTIIPQPTTTREFDGTFTVHIQDARLAIDPEHLKVRKGETHTPYLSLRDLDDDTWGELILRTEEARELAWALLYATGEDIRWPRKGGLGVHDLRAMLAGEPQNVEIIRTDPDGQPLDWPSATLTLAGHVIRVEMPHVIPGPEVNASYYNVSVEFEAARADADTFSVFAAEVAMVSRIVAWLDKSDDPFAAFEELVRA